MRLEVWVWGDAAPLHEGAVNGLLETQMSRLASEVIYKLAKKIGATAMYPASKQS